MGMSPKSGPLSVPSVSRSSMRPPSTMICVSSTTTVDSSARLDRMTPPCVVTSSTRETSW